MVYIPGGVLAGPGGTSQAGSDVAKATGVAYTDIGKTEDNTAQPGYNAEATSEVLGSQAKLGSGLSYVDADKSTVAGQLNTLLQGDSAYIKQAEEAGKEQAAARGLLNSSAAAGSARKAAIGAAMPIAQQDAQTYATAQGREQAGAIAQTQTQTEGIVSGEMNAQNAAIAQKAQDIQNIFQAKMQGASESNKVLLQDMQNSYNTFNLEMQNEQANYTQNVNISAEKAAGIRTQASAIMQNYQVSVENLMTDPDFMNLGPAAMNKAINEMQTLARNSINFLGAASKIDLTSYVNAYLKKLNVA